MSVSSTVTFSATGGATTLSGISSSATGNLGIDVSVAVPATTTNQLYTLAVDVSQIQSLFLYSDGVLTLKTNSTGSPDQTLVFAANMPLVWVTGMPSANPLTTDVTKFYITNATAGTLNLYGFINQSL